MECKNRAQIQKDVQSQGNIDNSFKSLLGLSLSEKNMKFTPTTPYVHKFRTEMCKNFELYGQCKYVDEVSI
jgi:hypothetical protein